VLLDSSLVVLQTTGFFLSVQVSLKTGFTVHKNGLSAKKYST
jgi:hypothetical protein